MKTNIILLFTITFCATMNAQFSETFEGGIPGSMLQEFHNGTVSWTDCDGNAGGATCPINDGASASFFSTSSNPLSTSLSTPTLDLSTGDYRLSFKHLHKKLAGNQNYLYLEYSLDGGVNWTIFGAYNNNLAQYVYEGIDLSPLNPTSTTRIRFRAENHGGFALVLDDISISLIPDNDVKFLTIDMEDITLAENKTISGTFINNGTNTVNSVDVNWQADSGTIYTETFSGLNLNANEEYNFTHADQWDATVGSHSLKVWVSNLDGNGDDDDTSNDDRTNSVFAITNFGTRIPVYEEFTSSTCGPCAELNLNYFNDAFLLSNENKFSLIKYQMSWPAPGDPYYTAEGGVRKDYYGVNAVPALFLDAVEGTAFSVPSLQNKLDNALAVASYFDMTVDYTLNGTTIDINVSTMPYIDGEYTLHVVVVEKTTTGNIMNNGETSFNNVMMKMLPNASGTLLNLTHNVSEDLNFNYDLSGTNIEEFSDLQVVAFLQNNSSKEVMQSINSDYILSNGINNNLSKIILYPNPTDGILYIGTENNVDISIIDMVGKMVHIQKNVTSTTAIDVSKLTQGVYFVNIVNGSQKEVKRVVIK